MIPVVLSLEPVRTSLVGLQAFDREERALSSQLAIDGAPQCQTAARKAMSASRAECRESIKRSQNPH
jgi:hypothetical protein